MGLGIQEEGKVLALSAPLMHHYNIYTYLANPYLKVHVPVVLQSAPGTRDRFR